MYRRARIGHTLSAAARAYAGSRTQPAGQAARLPDPYSVIHAPRLDLVPMTPELMRALIAGDWATADRLLEAQLPQEWRTKAGSTSEPTVVGEIGFHGPPDETGRVEIGYTVVTEYRRRGFAEEAARALLAWAAREHGITRFRACVSPQNAPSLNLMGKLGFIRVGAYRHDERGEQLVFHRDGAPG